MGRLALQESESKVEILLTFKARLLRSYCQAFWHFQRVCCVGMKRSGLLGQPEGAGIASRRWGAVHCAARAKQVGEDRLQCVGPNLISLDGRMQFVAVH